MRIDRCVCHNVFFSALADTARKNECESLEQLMSCASFGQGCGYCHAYVEQMLETGETVFTEILPRRQPWKRS